MKKILRFIPISALVLFMTGCYTNVIDLDDEGGGGDDNNKVLVISDPSQLNQQIFAESRICEVKFSSEFGWEINNMDEQTRKWITLSPSHSEVGGSFTLSISVDENASGGDRTAILQLFSGGKDETIIITQFSTYKDGSQPQPYEPDVYTDIVEKIVLQNSSNGEIEPPTREWRFITNHTTRKVDIMSLYLTDPHDERAEEQIIIHDYRILERTAFGLIQPNDRWDVMFRQYSELSVNPYNFLTYQHIEELDYQNGANPEPIIREIIYRYSAYRRVSEQSDGHIYEYQWADGNMVEQKETPVYGEESNTLYSLIYRTEPNDRANIDLNTLLSGDMYSAMGLLGKRSKNLLESITDSKGGVINFEYSFDQKGRVETITQRVGFNGSIESVSTVFTVHYINDNNGGDNVDPK